MAKPRTPVAKAKAAGRDIVNAGRYKDRKEPKAPSLGNPPTWMDKDQQSVWEQFSVELPWLNGSHRSLMEIAVSVRARIVCGQDVGVQAMNLLRQCLGQMGATPADATKVTVSDEGEDEPEDKFFN